MLARTFVVPVLILAGLCVSTVQADPPVTQDLLLWLDAEQGVTTDPNGNVVNWGDLGATGGANDAAQLSASDRPFLTTGGPLGNRQVIEFEDKTVVPQPIDDYLEIGPSSAFDFQSCTWFVVFRSDNGYEGTLIRSAYDSLGAGGSTDPVDLNNTWGSYLSTAGDDGVRSHFRGLDGSFNAESVGVADPSQFHIASVVRDGLFLDRWVIDPNGVATQGASTLVDSDPSGHVLTRIGASSTSDFSPSTFFAGDIAEVLVYDAALSTSDRQTVEQYLYDKWFAGTNPALSVTSDLVLWLRADAGVMTGPNGRVSSWVDQAALGGANDAAQADSTAQPVLVDNASPLGDLPVIRFAGDYFQPAPIDDYLEIGPSSALDFESCAWFMVFKSDNGYDGTLIRSAYDSLGPGGSTSDVHLANVWGTYLSTAGDDGARAHFRGLDGSFNAESTGVSDPGQFHIASVVRDGTALDRWVIDPDGIVTQGATTTGVDSVPSGHRFTRIGASSTSSLDPDLFFAGDIAEVLVYSTAPSTGDREAIEQYLYDKWFVGGSPTLSVTSDLVVWLRADAGVVADPNGRVSTWMDQAALGGTNDAGQANGTAQPVLVPNASPLRDLPVIRFAGDHFPPAPEGEYLDVAGNSTFDGDVFTWFMVAQTDRPDNIVGGVLMRSRYADIGGSMDPVHLALWGTVMGTPNGGGPRSFTRGAGGSFMGVSATPADLSQYFLITAAWDGVDELNTWHVDPNGVAVLGPDSPKTGANAAPTGHQRTRFGAGFSEDDLFDPIEFFSGRIGEVLVYNAELSPAEMTAVEEYLFEKWFTYPADVDGDGDVDFDDLDLLTDCLNGPGVSIPPGGCSVDEFADADLDDDGDCDLADIAKFAIEYPAP